MELNLSALNNYGIGLEQVRNTLSKANANRPKGEVADQTHAWAISATDQLLKRGPVQPADRRLQQRRCRPAFRRRRRDGFGRGRAQCGYGRRHPVGPDHHLPATRREHHRHGGSGDGGSAAIAGLDLPGDQDGRGSRPHHDDSGVGPRCRVDAAYLDLAGHPGGFSFPAELARHVDSGRGGSDFADRNFRRHVPVRVQPRQPVADGAHHLDRLRRRRRDRGDREHLPLPRAGHGALRGGRARGARNRLHGGLDQRLAGRGVYPDFAHGRDRRPSVPRIRGHAVDGGRGFDGGFADHHADDVRQAAAARGGRSRTDGSTARASESSTVRWLDTRSASRGCCGIRA